VVNKKRRVTKEKVRRLRKKLSEAKPIKPRISRKNTKRTWCEQALQDLLDDMGIPYEIEIPLPFKLSWKHYDVGLEEYPILIEVDGDYWHGNKKNLTEEQKINWMQMKNKQNDLLKNWVAKNKGYTLIRVWESEIKDDLPAVRAKIRKVIREVKSLKDKEN
jgi:G:T-mismatch repair DNA endonuclease (very short patch repair protein)